MLTISMASFIPLGCLRLVKFEDFWAFLADDCSDEAQLELFRFISPVAPVAPWGSLPFTSSSSSSIYNFKKELGFFWPIPTFNSESSFDSTASRVSSFGLLSYFMLVWSINRGKFLLIPPAPPFALICDSRFERGCAAACLVVESSVFNNSWL